MIRTRGLFSQSGPRVLKWIRKCVHKRPDKHCSHGCAMHAVSCKLSQVSLWELSPIESPLNRIVDGNMPIKARHSVGNKQRSLSMLFTYSLCLHVVNALDQLTQISINQTKLHNLPTKHNWPLKQSWFKDHGNVLRSKQPTFRFVPPRYLAFWERSPMWLAEADIENERQVSKSASLVYVYLCLMCSNKC